jgi:urease accessory protein
MAAMITGTGTSMTDMPHGGRFDLPLLLWLSPAFPVGAFAYSHGLEWAVECGDIKDAAGLSGWIGDLFAEGSVRNDALLLAAAYRAASLCDGATLRDINDLALALSPSRERRLETGAQGTAFMTAARAAWPCAALDLLASGVEEVAYPVALGVAAAGHDLALAATLQAFLAGFAANLVSAAVRLGPIGQTDGQRILAGLLPAIATCAEFALQASLDDLGGAALRSDIASMRHETQYSRLFRS